MLPQRPTASRAEYFSLRLRWGCIAPASRSRPPALACRRQQTKHTIVCQNTLRRPGRRTDSAQFGKTCSNITPESVSGETSGRRPPNSTQLAQRLANVGPALATLWPTLAELCSLRPQKRSRGCSSILFARPARALQDHVSVVLVESAEGRGRRASAFRRQRPSGRPRPWHVAPPHGSRRWLPSIGPPGPSETPPRAMPQTRRETPMGCPTTTAHHRRWMARRLARRKREAAFVATVTRGKRPSIVPALDDTRVVQRRTWHEPIV